MKANYEDKTKLNGNLSVSLYDLNKQAVAQLPSLADDEIAEKYNLIDSFGCGKEWCMLLGREIGYYTLFHHIPKDAEETFAAAVLECCGSLGQIKAIDWANEDQQAIEIWIKQEESTTATVLYLFDYSQGVIECQM